MPRTYSGDPTTSALDEVRFLIADTDFTKPWSLLDAEINYAIRLYSANPPVIGQNFYAAWRCALNILGRLKSAPLGAKRVGDLSIQTAPSTIQFYQDTARRLEASANLQGVPMYVGGLSISEKEGQDQDPDRVAPAFQVGGMANISPLNGQGTPDDPSNGI